MSNEIATQDQNTALQLPDYGQQDMGALTEMTRSSSAYLNRFQLYTKGKAINHGLIAPGRYGISESEDEITDLGKEVDVLVLAWRPKALDISDLSNIITNFDPSSEEFQRIQAAESIKDSGCMYGPSFLLYERTTGRFVEWFCNNKSSRIAAGKVSAFLPKEGKVHAMTLGVRVAEKKGTNESWHVSTVNECSTPIALPDAETVNKEVQKFLNPPKPEAEAASEAEAEVVNRRAR